MANKIKYIGHAAFSIVTSAGKTIFIDPFLDENPTSTMKADQVEACDVILITHDHFDHLGNSPDIIKKCGGIAVGVPETVAKLKEAGVADDNIVNFGYGMNIGGTSKVEGISVVMTQAFHSDTSNPTGFIIQLEDGKTIYHAGDTGIFSTMSVLGEIYDIDLAMLPMGSVFTMDPLQAAVAAKMLDCNKVIPMHFKTFPILEQSADRFVEIARKEAPGVEVVVLEPRGEYRW